jgi:hypothetical protein
MTAVASSVTGRDTSLVRVGGVNMLGDALILLRCWVSCSVLHRLPCLGECDVLLLRMIPFTERRLCADPWRETSDLLMGYSPFIGVDDCELRAGESSSLLRGRITLPSATSMDCCRDRLDPRGVVAMAASTGLRKSPWFGVYGCTSRATSLSPYTKA